jgi:hypothetical protein
VQPKLKDGVMDKCGNINADRMKLSFGDYYLALEEPNTRSMVGN